MNVEAEYRAQIALMAENAKRWRAANPGREALVQYNFPRDVLFIQPISLALEMKAVSTNDAGLELLRAMWPEWDKLPAKEPTVLMVKVALEASQLEI